MNTASPPPALAPRPSPDEVSLRWGSLSITLDGPGSFEEYAAARVVIGVRPGPWQYCAAIFAPLFGLTMGGFFWLIEIRWLGVLLGLLFAGAGLAALFFQQRTEITPGRVGVQVRQLGGSWSREWVLPADSACRVEGYPERDGESLWTCYHAEIRTADGWIALAESLNRERAGAFTARMAAAAGVPRRAANSARPFLLPWGADGEERAGTSFE